MKQRKYVIYIDGELIPVEEKVYKAFYKSKNKENYLEKRDKKNNLLYYSAFDTENSNYEEYLEDKNVNVEQIVEAKLLMEELYSALDSLNDEERDLLTDLFFEELSLRDASRKRNISHVALMKRRDKILKKLRNILELYKK